MIPDIHNLHLAFSYVTFVEDKPFIFGKILVLGIQRICSCFETTLVLVLALFTQSVLLTILLASQFYLFALHLLICYFLGRLYKVSYRHGSNYDAYDFENASEVDHAGNPKGYPCNGNGRVGSLDDRSYRYEVAQTIVMADFPWIGSNYDDKPP